MQPNHQVKTHAWPIDRPKNSHICKNKKLFSSDDLGSRSEPGRSENTVAKKKVLPLFPLTNVERDGGGKKQGPLPRSLQSRITVRLHRRRPKSNALDLATVMIIKYLAARVLL